MLSNYLWVYPEGIFNNKKVYKWDSDFNFPVDYKTGKKYAEIPCSFDIETTSFEMCDLKVGSMYVWQFAIYDVVFMGRTWEEFIYFLNNLIEYLKIDKYKLVVYVHNLSFEFSFIRKQLHFSKVFAINTRRPLYAITEKVEFRCSYLLSGLSLQNVAKQWCSANNQKLVGDLDYSKERYCNTPLTYNDICYCINDVTIITEYISKLIEKKGSIENIPYTKTGEVREFCRNRCLYKKINKKKTIVNKRYKELMRLLTLTPSEYKLLVRAYTGGFTHANWSVINKVIENVASYDFTSSYPAVMCSEMFPMSKGKEFKRFPKEKVIKLFKSKCTIVNVRFKNLQSKFIYENYLSCSKCYGISTKAWRIKKKIHSIRYEKKLKSLMPFKKYGKIFNILSQPLNYCKNKIINNGRVVSAGYLETTITEVDFQIINKCYTWDKIEFGRGVYYEKGYLPKPLIECVLEFYEYKTTLKDVKGFEEFYQNNKEKLNATYGMMVTSIVRDIFKCIDGDWIEPEAPNLEKEIEKYNKNPKRFLFYPWGVYIVKYATRNLWSAILSVGKDHLYSDTDSEKLRNYLDHKEYFEEYNKKIIYKIWKCLTTYNINPERMKPQTKNGDIKILGVWDFEGVYTKFKTLGAKRYFVEYKDKGKLKYKATVAGCPKKAMENYLYNKGEGDSNKIFENFHDRLYIPKGEAQKNLISYYDFPFEALRLDYLGNLNIISEKTCVNVSANSFDMTMSEEFIRFLNMGYKYL